MELGRETRKAERKRVKRNMGEKRQGEGRGRR